MLRTTLLATALALGLAAPAPAQDLAQELTLGPISIAHPWARPGIPNRPVAAYLGIENRGDADDRLVAVASPAFASAELHASEERDGVSTMRRVEAVELPAGGGAEFAPGGYHVMLFGPERPFAEGERFPLTLTFEKAGTVEVEVAVERYGPGGASGGSHGGGHGH
jgi:copper(I)-binding protein